MRKLTPTDYIKRCREVHGDRYDYSNCHYEWRRGVVTILCPSHGAFEQRADAHARGQGCNQCRSEDFRLTTSEFIRRAKIIHGEKYRYDSTIYKSAYEMITIECPVHGQFEQRAHDHTTGKGCSKCGKLNNLGGWSRLIKSTKDHWIPGRFYLNRWHLGDDLYIKIGITTTSVKRRDDDRGFSITPIIDYECPIIYAFVLEQHILKTLGPQFNTEISYIAGWTETFPGYMEEQVLNLYLNLVESVPTLVQEAIHEWNPSPSS